MIAERIDQLELLEFWYEDDPTMRVKANFPFCVRTGIKSTAVVYFDLEPGHRLATHTDSAEDILMVLEGTAEVFLGDEQGRLSAGEMALVPTMVPHALRNAGEETVRVVGFFSSNVVVSTFEQPMMPFNQRVVGTPPVLEEEQVPSANASVRGGKGMARILTIDPKQTRGLRKALFWVNERQYGGVVPGIFGIMFRDLNIAFPGGWLYNYLHMRKSSPITRLLREMLAAVVSGLVGGAP